MTTVTNIAQRILDENNYTTPSPTVTEYLIDNAVKHVNLNAGTSISFTASSGSASLTASDNEILVVKEVTSLFIRAYNDRGPNTSVNGISLSSITSDPHYVLFADMIKRDIDKLRARTIQRT